MAAHHGVIVPSRTLVFITDFLKEWMAKKLAWLVTSPAAKRAARTNTDNDCGAWSATARTSSLCNGELNICEISRDGLLLLGAAGVASTAALPGSKLKSVRSSLMMMDGRLLGLFLMSFFAAAPGLGLVRTPVPWCNSKLRPCVHRSHLDGMMMEMMRQLWPF
jgi:hypothetical protein